MIEVKSLIKKYPGKLAVDDVSFSIGRREIVGLLGANGAGKSTIMNMITGYTAMTSGTIIVDGLDILEEPMGVRKKIGYLPEQPPLYGDMTVEEYLNFVFALKKSKTNRLEDIRQACVVMDITDVKGRLIKHLSKGYRQRVGFAQALIGNPDILILDEPTVGLDPKQIIEIRKIIQILAKERTIILSSHILNEVQAVCQRVLVMDKGKLVADEKTDRLFEHMTGTERIKLRVTGKEEDIKETLKNIQGIKTIETKGQTEPGVFNFVVGTKKKAEGVNIRMSITKELAKKGMYIVEMQGESMNLEDIFLRLTSENTQEADK